MFKTQESLCKNIFIRSIDTTKEVENRRLRQAFNFFLIFSFL